MGDLLIYKNDTTQVYRLILEQYFKQAGYTDNGQLFGFSFRGDGMQASTNCWRGYQAMYKVEHDSLFLIHILRCGEFRYKRNSLDIVTSDKRMEEIFKDRVVDHKVFIDWYSGDINIPDGKFLRFDGIFHRSFEREISLTIHKGILNAVVNLQNYVDHPNRINRRYGDSIKKVFYENIMHADLNWLLTVDEIYPNFKIMIGKNGSIEKVTMINVLGDDETSEFDRKQYRHFHRSIMRQVRMLRFDILKDEGKKIVETIYLEMSYDSNDKSWTYRNW